MIGGCGGGAPRGTTVFAAASLTDVLTRIAVAYEQETGSTVRLSFGASGALARQIQQGAPCDLFLSAAPEWVDVLTVRSRRDLLKNRLVLVAPSPGPPPDRTPPGRIAMADPERAPAGRYGREALARLGWWDGARVVPAEDVRAALRLVELGEADWGLVYATDARASGRVAVRLEFDAAAVYAAALLTAEGEPFDRYLGGPGAQGLFREAGFLPAGP